MTIRTRLAIATLLPLLGLAYFAGQGLLESYHLKAEMGSVRQSTARAGKISNLVHELQKERGLSAGYLGSKGAKFANELRAQRGETDQRLEALSAALGNGKLEGEFGARLTSALEAIRQLEQRRQSTESLEASVKDTVGFYTGINTSLLDAIQATSFSSQANVNRRLTAYVNFLKSKERAGIERAVLATTFARDSFAPGMYQKFIQLLTQQSTYETEFLLLAQEKDVEFFNRTMDAAVLEEVNSFRELAKEKAATGGFGADASEWFAAQTKRINLLKQVDDYLAGEVVTYASELQSRAAAQVWTFLISTLAVAGVAGAFSVVTRAAILTGIGKVTERLEEMSNGDGDLTTRLPEGQDELGTLSRQFNVFVAQIHDVIFELSRDTRALSQTSDQIRERAVQLSGEASDSKEKSATVSNAAEQMTDTMKSMAATTQQISTSMNMVSTSVDEMTNAITEISESAERTARIATEAVSMADESNGRISQLGTAAEEIGKVIEVIQDIAEQTNLLALNATIEAARAGESGKGFAVVATEVKELARQTAAATDDIRTRIEGIQQSTGKAVESISAISDVIRNVNEAGHTIASAVEEQSITTRQISQHVAEAASSADDAARNVADSATTSEEISRSILQVDRVLSGTVEGAKQSEDSGEELSQLASQLGNVVGRFRLRDAAETNHTSA